jgi:hypothetical protein
MITAQEACRAIVVMDAARAHIKKCTCYESVEDRIELMADLTLARGALLCAMNGLNIEIIKEVS